jgi:ubiquinone/menaquinone biosynthesis C-methylase UbiE
MGRGSRPLAEEFVRWLDLLPGGHWLDVGTGTGALAAAIWKLTEPASVVGCDPSAAFIDSARRGLTDPRVTFVVAGAGALPRREGGYDAVVSGLALNFFPDPAQAMRAQLCLLRPGGVVGALVWDYAEGMEFLRHFWDAAAAIEPGAAEMDEGKRFRICHPEALDQLLTTAGAERVRVDSLSLPTVFSSFDDYWQPFLGGTGPAPALVESLSGEQYKALVTELKRRLPVKDSGTIELEARAWAVAGERP